MLKTLLFCFAVILLCGSTALATINVYSDGSDGALSPCIDCPHPGLVIDLSQAVTGTWNQAGNGKGVYDPEKWAVVFKYSSVNIPAGVAVTFKNHPSGAPVVWLVQGDAAILGSVDLSGTMGSRDADPAGLARYVAAPGPGGFRGGATGVGSYGGGGGLGPGGGYSTVGATYSNGTGTVYGNAGIIPLMGGSGGTAFYGGSPGGGGGGGAILLAVGGTLTLSGSLAAYGGPGNCSGMCSGDGTGGAIRVIADKVFGAGRLTASSCGYFGGCNGGIYGRIRVEANQSDWSLSSSPAFTYAPPGATAQIWPPSNSPVVKIASLGGQAIASDLQAGVTYSTVDAYLSNPASTKALIIQAQNVPLNWKVKARVMPLNGTPTWVYAGYVSGTQALSTWQADLTLGLSYTVIQVRASAN